MSKDFKVTHQAPFNAVACFLLSLPKDVRTPCVKMMTTYSAVWAWWVYNTGEK